MSICVDLWLKRLLWVAPFAFLWFMLINQVRVEWTVNPQYSFGWLVPVLCLGLLWKRWRREQGAGGGSQASEVRNQRSGVSGPRPHFSFQLSAFSFLPVVGGGPWSLVTRHSSLLTCVLFVFCALLYAPTRLVQAANPEWRLVSWLLAMEVIGLSLLALHLALDQPARRPADHGLRTAAFVFPLCFFLVAVPWPTVLEGPLIQGLTRANTGTTVELLGWLGLPAVQQGNVIEIKAGTVGVDEACSGIRSFQSSLMISLFLGELYRLSILQRTCLCLSGFALAFAFNVCRTLTLVCVAAKKGIAAVSDWHDPAGLSITVACLAGLWLLSGLFKKYAQGTGRARPPTAGHGLQIPSADLPTPISRLAPLRPLLIGLVLWLLVAEVGVELWYRVHEGRLRPSAVWTVQPPRGAPAFAELPLSDKARQFLRYDDALNVSWQEGNTRWQMISLRWKPGRIAVHLAKSHTPEVCLTAAGKELVSRSDLKRFDVQGLALPFRSYAVEERGRPFYIFYCLWEDRAQEQSFKTEVLTYGNRFGPVLAGRRNLGQQSLELAVWGLDDAQEAEAAVVRQLAKLIRVEKP